MPISWGQRSGHHFENWTFCLWFAPQSCENLNCASFNCSIPEATSSHVNLTFRVWKPTFIKVGFKVVTHGCFFLGITNLTDGQTGKQQTFEGDFSYRASFPICTCWWTVRWGSETRSCLNWAAVTGPEVYVFLSYMLVLSFNTCVRACGHLLYMYVCANQAKIPVSKETLGGIPIWIIILSILIGLLILALVIFALWKVRLCFKCSNTL